MNYINLALIYMSVVVIFSFLKLDLFALRETLEAQKYEPSFHYWKSSPRLRSLKTSSTAPSAQFMESL